MGLVAKWLCQQTTAPREAAGGSGAGWRDGSPARRTPRTSPTYLINFSLFPPVSKPRNTAGAERRAASWRQGRPAAFKPVQSRAGNGVFAPKRCPGAALSLPGSNRSCGPGRGFPASRHEEFGAGGAGAARLLPWPGAAALGTRRASHADWRLFFWLKCLYFPRPAALGSGIPWRRWGRWCPWWGGNAAAAAPGAQSAHSLPFQDFFSLFFPSFAGPRGCSRHDFARDVTASQWEVRQAPVRHGPSRSPSSCLPAAATASPRDRADGQRQAAKALQKGQGEQPMFWGGKAPFPLFSWRRPVQSPHP